LAPDELLQLVVDPVAVSIGSWHALQLAAEPHGRSANDRSVKLSFSTRRLDVLFICFHDAQRFEPLSVVTYRFRCLTPNTFVELHLLLISVQRLMDVAIKHDVEPVTVAAIKSALQKVKFKDLKTFKTFFET